METRTPHEWLKLAYELAAKLSTDPRTQNAAIIVQSDGSSIGSANRFPDGVKENTERWTAPLKYKFVEHAERNAIYRAALSGFKTAGATMYAPWFACAECARAIIQAGIVEVIGHDYPPHKDQVSWKESIEIADVQLMEAGIKFTRIPGHFGVKIRFNGQVVEV